MTINCFRTCTIALLLTCAVVIHRTTQATGNPFAEYDDIALRAGLATKTIIGEENVKKYLIESTGGGVALFDYDDDGWLDIFLTNGSRVQGFPPNEAPTNHLYRNKRDGTFEDVTRVAGLALNGWAQGVCVGDYNRDGRLDLYVTYYGRNVLYRNNGNGDFTDATQAAGLAQAKPAWSTGCTFVDYDRDGNLDLFVSNYVDYDDGLRELPDADALCRWKGMRVFCGPRGLRPARTFLYRNLGNGKFMDVTDKSGVAGAAPGYGFTAIAADFDSDGWPDLYVANDAAPNLLFRNKHNGTFEEIGLRSLTAYNHSGLLQAGMGVDVADYDGDGLLDIVKTNFSDDIPTLYRNLGSNRFSDEALGSGLHLSPHYLGWGVAFSDVDADGWADIVIANGHVYPGVEKVEYGAAYKERMLLYRNLGNGHFADVSAVAGPAFAVARAARGLAAGDIFNTGEIDFVVNNMWDTPALLHNSTPSSNRRIQVRLIGVDTNPHGIGSRVRVVAGNRSQFNEVRSASSFCSVSDMRLHFGVGTAERIDRLEVSWLGGETDVFTGLPSNHLFTIRQGAGIVERKALRFKTTSGG